MIPTLSEALAERGYDALTPVQEAVTDPALKDADLLVSAQTGSGKTVGFGLAIGPTILDEAGLLGPAAAPLALIVAPTRELAFQVTRELGWLYAKAGARIASCVGGMDMRDERRALERGAHIVVGTPGRLTDHIRRGSLDLSGVRAIVLDEADEMLDLGFREDLEFMLGEAPAERRTLLFSATVPPMIATLAQHYQRDAVRVTTLTERTQHADIAYQVLQVAPQDVENAIINVLRYHEAQNALVFANTRATVNRLAARFANRGFAVVSLSGELSQNERTHALQAMRDGRARVCVATDVAARGIDLPNLELVVHAELPTNAETLLHRSGRTGRAGRKGLSALVVPQKAARHVERLLKSARVVAEWTTAPGADEILRRDEERLLADPAWMAELTPDEAAFAARVLAAHGPQAIAAACLRFWRARHSAPEELADPAAPARERAPFGPGVWFTLSVGRESRAEARWLLPMLCRAGRIGKDAIGAIRVQEAETLVEIAEAAVPGFEATLGAGGVLEGGVTARRAEGPPEAGRAPAGRRAKVVEVAEVPPAPPPPPVAEVAPVALPVQWADALPAPLSAPVEAVAPPAEMSPPVAVEAARTVRRPEAGAGAKPARREPGEARGAPHKRAFGKPYSRTEGPKGSRDAAHPGHDRPRGKGAPAKGGWNRPEDARADASDTSRRFDPSERPRTGPKGGQDAPRTGKGAPAKGAWKKPEGMPANASDTSRRFDPSERPRTGPKGGHDAPRKGKGAPAKGGWKKPEAARADASDTSRRFDPSGRPGAGPKGGKSGGKGKPRTKGPKG
jgi:ATP-dependent RNA helicase DeaD